MSGRAALCPIDGEHFNIFDALDRLRARAVDLEALAYCAARRGAVPAATAEARREAERLASLVGQTHDKAADLLDEIKATIARLLLDARSDAEAP